MATATKPRKRAAKKQAGTAKPQQAVCGLIPEWSGHLSPADIRTSPFQTRQTFDQEKITALGQSMLAHGQAAAICVRSTPGGGFELLAGHRRLLAAINAGITSIRADVFHCNDAQARQIVIAENLHREDLNKIEEAEGFQMLLANDDFAGPTELAASIGKSQAYVSNTLRLLALPDFWKQKLISREITERHARAVLSFKEYPSLMLALEQAMADELADRGDAPDVSTWEATIPDIIREHTRTLDGIDGHVFDAKRGRNVEIFQPLPWQLNSLDVITVADERRAANVELWDELQEEHLKLQEEHVKDAATEDAEGGDQDESPETSIAADTDEEGEAGLQEPTPEAARASGREATGKDFASRLWAWKVMALRKMIADEIVHRLSLGQLAHLAVLAFGRWIEFGNGEILERAFRSAGFKKSKKSWIAPWASVCSLSDWDAGRVLGRMLAECFWSEENGPSTTVDGEEVVAVAAYLELDLDAAWNDGVIASPQGYWDLHTKEQLLAIAWETHLTATSVKSVKEIKAMSKADLVATFMAAMPVAEGQPVSVANGDGIFMPKEIAKAKQPKK